MGRNPINETEKRKQIYASAPKFIVDELGQAKCKDVADKAIIKEYEKHLKIK